MVNDKWLIKCNFKGASYVYNDKGSFFTGDEAEEEAERLNDRFDYDLSSGGYLFEPVEVTVVEAEAGGPEGRELRTVLLGILGKLRMIGHHKNHQHKEFAAEIYNDIKALMRDEGVTSIDSWEFEDD